ncbi:hypothetical protein Pan241w_13650 [Gimesia alba]|uniref:Methyltransferase domain protein n=1 Tax=Gimesia alba TaxID=2527973 RepID=A0A517RBR3_9PLAN|nr:hypothetical protein [Gimesia alba]QDT41305.1 hypothetical protein Pan241w_13650 [Gimesia alba]
MNKLFEGEFQFNLASRPNWETGARHRETLMKYLTGLVGDRQGRLCVLGAGNCNDLDLKRLLQVYSEVHLVDLDESALEYGVQSQEVADDPRVFRYVRDLTGAGEELAGFEAASTLPETDLSEIIQRFSQPAALDLPGPFDVVCSTCVLSQLILQAVNAVGDTHPQFEQLMVAIRSQHFQTIVDLIKEGGAGLVVSDFVSSESATDLKDVPDFQFTQYLSQLLSSRNFFHGVHPGVLFSQLKGNAPLAGLVQNVEMLPPWRWDLGSRQYAVAAIRFHRLPRS